jgi:hypothetical protein
LEQMPNLRARHALQTSRTTGKHARKVGRDGVVKPDDAVGENPGNCSGQDVSPGRNEERFERLLNQDRKRPCGMFHSGVSGMSYMSFQYKPRWRQNALTVKNGGEYPVSAWGHLPMLYAHPVLTLKLVRLARLEIYRVDSSDRSWFCETLELCRQSRLLKNPVGPALGASQAQIRRSKVPDFIEGSEIF